MANINDLKTKAAQIKNATQVGENTASRVGGAIADAAELIEAQQTELESVKGTASANAAGLAAETGQRETEDERLESLISSLQTAVNTLLNGDASKAIDNFNEVLAFLEGLQDDEKLASKLTAIGSSISSLQSWVKELNALRTKGYRFMGVAKPTTTPGTISENIFYLATTPGTYTYFKTGVSIKDGEDVLHHTLSDGEVAILCKKWVDTHDPLTPADIFGWTKITLDIAKGSDLAALVAKIGAKNGIAPLDYDGLIPVENLPEDVYNVRMVLYWDEREHSATSAKMYHYNPSEKKLYKSVWKTGTREDGFIYKGYFWDEETLSDGCIYVDMNENVPYRWDGTDMVAIAPKDTPASIFNATVEVPITGYYTLVDAQNASSSAVHAAWNAGKAVGGLMLSFELSAGVWKTYQYIGKTVTEANWLNADNWKDFGSLAAGSEPYIIINDLCGAPIAGSYYTLETAVARLVAYQQTSGVVYAKKGLIISYAIGENEMETKQFQGEVSDFGEVGLWKDFGGGSKVETKDEPEEDGEDALSTGGAYTHIPATLAVDTETQGVVKIKMQNAKGDDVGDEVQFSVGTGGGGGSGTIVSLAFRQAPFYGNAGGEFILQAAVRSVTTIGKREQANSIAKIDCYDRDTNTLLKTFNVNQPSSADLESYDFSLDVSQFFATAGLRRLRFVATDDAENTGSRNVNVTAVDVTISSAQTLHYTASTSLVEGGASRSITMYKFANQSSAIVAVTEILLNGQWQELGRATITDPYSHGVAIDPTNCLGVALSHGAYLLRIHGEDVESGVVGNYLYMTVFIIGETNTTPLVAMRWLSDGVSASVKLYETISVEYAVYDPTNNAPMAYVLLDGVQVSSHVAYRSATYTYSHQVTGVASDGSFAHRVQVRCGTTYGEQAEFRVSGSVIDAALKDGALMAFDFASRSNDEADKTIKSGDYEIAVEGSNYSTTGFLSYMGRKCFRFAEDVTGLLNWKPYKPTSIESTGMAMQFSFLSRNLVDDDARLMECYDEGTGAGFYVTGKAVGIYCATGISNHVEERAYKQGEFVTVGIIVEPVVEGLGKTRNGTTYYFIKLYMNGEEVAVVGYVSGQSNLLQEKSISFYGKKGDFYLEYFVGWDDYFQFDQAFQNYLVKLTDTNAMATEYAFENVMATQQAVEQGETTFKLRPQAASLADRGMPYVVEYPFNGSDIEALDVTTSTKQNNYITQKFVHPTKPWLSFIAYDVRRRNQGTTSAKRPVKNPRYYFAQKNGSTYDKATKTGGTRIEPLYTCEQIVQMGYDGKLWDAAAALFAINKVQLFDDSIPVDIITIKVDFSDSSNANDCGVCDQMNTTFRALGADYMTPAQRAYDGTWYKGNVHLTGLQMNHSTRNYPIAIYRSKNESGTDPYFHAKGNWKEDKKEQVALGFKDVSGYNKGCLNYGDFVEFYGLKNETLAATLARFRETEGLDETKTYVLTQYCGPNYRVVKYVSGSWSVQTGSMKQVNGSWQVSGSVLNPVDGYELLNYQGMDWFKGVSSVDDMMAPSTSFSKWVQQLIDDGDISVETVPAWTYFFECLLDDDDLAVAYALGKKVPYNLFRWLVFCDSCDYEKNGQTGLDLWKTDLYKYASPQSVMAYDVFSDYDAAVDQRAKNMQPMWFLEDGHYVENGQYDSEEAMRMYLNKVYDCDTCNGFDNDGGETVDAEVDPNKMPDAATGYTNPYAGYNSVLFRNIYLQQTVYVDAAGTELTLKTVASAMRNCTATVDGVTLKPFSPEGALYFFVTARVGRWQKKVSSYDGERKYIDFMETSDAVYLYALHGLRLTSLPAFIERRWRIRDGYFGVGDFFSGVLSGRVNSAAGTKIRIRAAKTGYFGIGNDSSGSISESVYLEAGEEYSFTKFSHEEGALLYIYQADRMSMIDVSEITLSNNFDFSVMTLAEEIYIGSTTHQNLTIGAYTLLTNVNLGELPFLKVLDVQRTKITNIVCNGCPRLETIKAKNSELVRCDLADGANITRMELPATYSYLRLRYLPKMELSGLDFADARNVTTLICENNTKIDAMELLALLTVSGSKLKVVRATPIAATGDGSELDTWMGLAMTGFDATLTAQNSPALIGQYRLNTYAVAEQIATWQAAFPELRVFNSMYSDYVESDSETASERITNMDNKTGYKYGTDYVPSGHVVRIRERCKPVAGKFNKETLKMALTVLSVLNYALDAEGNEFDPTDQLGQLYDIYLYLCRFWYKGINDFKSQEKHTLLSSSYDEPGNTWTEKNESVLSDILFAENKGLEVANLNVGATFSDASVSDLTSCNVYRMDVEGMTQVRYIGLNNASYGSVFVDESGKILQKDVLAISGTAANPLDFSNEQGDYIFRDVPTDAKWIYFTCMRGLADEGHPVIAVDSSDIEAIEPGWVEHRSELIGVYGITIDDLGLARSISGRVSKRGNGTSQTSAEWVYDEDGNATKMPVGTINWTAQDFLAACSYRGKGCQGISYEQSKMMAVLSRCYTGNIDDQRVYGFGTSSGYITGTKDSIGMADTVYGAHSGTNKVWGLEGFIACNVEWMDNLGVNVQTFAGWKARKRVDKDTCDTIDAKWHIYDPYTKTERVVQGITDSGGRNIMRVKHGRYCDVIASSTSSDMSAYNTGYGAGQWYSASRGRVVLRASNYAYAYGGLVYAGAHGASSYSGSYFGSRLAFCGAFENEKDVDAECEET